jgi:S1-C subfamily serine protease
MTGEDGGLSTAEGGGQDYLKTDASITHGNSGGPAVDDQGRLIGIATAFRVKVTASGGIVESAKVGLIRPLAAASDLLAIATAGWTPREGATTVELEPTAVDAPAEGIRISTDILDAANKAPVNGALLMVLRPGVATTDIDMNRLDELVIAWGRSNAQGEVHLKQPVPAPGTYSVMVVARGYEPLIGANALKLTESAPAFFDPWGQITIEAK